MRMGGGALIIPRIARAGAAPDINGLPAASLATVIAPDKESLSFSVEICDGTPRGPSFNARGQET
jgi:hypothetical protein